MATSNTVEKAKMNVYQKLIKARQMFLSGGVDKSGKNPSLEFKYFELKDIVPKATDIFVEVGLIGTVSFSEERAVMNIIDCDNPEDAITFTSPMRFVEANRGTNPLMALGASHTYMRRYMYMLAMDVCEPDAIDGGLLPSEDTASSKKSKKAPATPEQRKEIKEELTATDEPAGDLQINALIAACNALMDKDAEQEEFVQQLAMQTNGFKDITKSQCEDIINAINEMLTKYQEA